MSKRSELRKAVAAYLRDLAFPCPVRIVSDRLVAPQKLEELVHMPVLTVLPLGLASELESRASFAKEMTVAILVQQKLDRSLEIEQADGLLELVELVFSHLEELETGGDGLPLAPWAVLETLTNDTPYEPDELREGVFTSVIVAGFALSGGSP